MRPDDDASREMATSILKRRRLLQSRATSTLAVFSSSSSSSSTTSATSMTTTTTAPIVESDTLTAIRKIFRDEAAHNPQGFPCAIPIALKHQLFVILGSREGVRRHVEAELLRERERHVVRYFKSAELGDFVVLESDYRDLVTRSKAAVIADEAAREVVEALEIFLEEILPKTTDLLIDLRRIGELTWERRKRRIILKGARNSNDDELRDEDEAKHLRAINGTSSRNVTTTTSSSSRRKRAAAKHNDDEEEEEDDPEIVRKMILDAQKIASNLCRLGFLVHKTDSFNLREDEGSYYFSIPMMRGFSREVVNGRQEILKRLRDSRVPSRNRLFISSLPKTGLFFSAVKPSAASAPKRTSSLSIWYHVRDVVGLGLALLKDSPSGGANSVLELV